MTDLYICPLCGLTAQTHEINGERWCLFCNSTVTPYRWSKERPTKPGPYWALRLRGPISQNNPDIIRIYISRHGQKMVSWMDTQTVCKLDDVLMQNYQFAPVVPAPTLPKEDE
jgi:hypothetical protein